MNNICDNCKTENESQYKYCKNCGGPLNAQSPDIENKTFKQEPKIDFVPPNPNIKYAQPQYNSRFFTVDSFDGVSAEEMVIFVGKKAENILPKFSKMQISGSKISWTWPAAILGYIFGPLGSALWFFYRKMYKPAAIFAVIGAVITILTGILSMGANDLISDSTIESFMSGDFNSALSSFKENVENTTLAETIASSVGTLINEFANIAACIVSGIYGMYFYKQHAINKITNYKAYQADSRFYKMGLAALGGCSGGMLAVGIIIMLAADSVVNFVTGIFSLII